MNESTSQYQTFTHTNNASVDQAKPEKMMDRTVVDFPYRGNTTRHTCYTLNSNAYSPSQILDEWPSNFCFMSCGQLIHFAAYRVMSDVWGKAQFDKFFPTGSFRLTTTLNNAFDPVSAFFKPYDIRQDQGFIAGQCYHFANHPSYRYRDLSGDSGSWNVVCSDATPGNEKFIGLGLPLNCTKLDLKQALVSDYNSPPYNERVFSPIRRDMELRKIRKVQASRIQDYGSQVPETITLDELDQSGAGLDRSYSFELSLDLLRNEGYKMKLRDNLA